MGELKHWSFRTHYIELIPYYKHVVLFGELLLLLNAGSGEKAIMESLQLRRTSADRFQR